MFYRISYETIDHRTKTRILQIHTITQLIVCFDHICVNKIMEILIKQKYLFKSSLKKTFKRLSSYSFTGEVCYSSANFDSNLIRRKRLVT